MIAVPGLTTRGVTYAKAQVRDLATHGQRLARDADGQVKQVTGRRTAAWIDRASRLAENHRWVTFGLSALALYALFVLLI